MKPESIDALILDRAFGELSREASELLDEHLAGDPQLAERAAKFSATVSTAKLALSARQMQANDSPLPEPRWRDASVATDRARHRRGLRWLSVQPLRLAASLAAGAALGWFSRPAVPLRFADAQTEFPAASQVSVRTYEPQVAAVQSNFWTQSSLIRVEPVNSGVDRAPARYRLRWESLSQKPIFEEEQ